MGDDRCNARHGLRFGNIDIQNLPVGNVAVFGFCDQHARQIVVVAIAARTGQLQIRVHTGQPLPHVFIAFFSHIICPLWWSRGRIP